MVGKNISPCGYNIAIIYLALGEKDTAIRWRIGRWCGKHWPARFRGRRRREAGRGQARWSSSPTGFSGGTDKRHEGSGTRASEQSDSFPFPETRSSGGEGKRAVGDSASLPSPRARESPNSRSEPLGLR